MWLGLLWAGRLRVRLLRAGMWNRAVDGLPGSRLLLSARGLWIWMFGGMRLSAGALRVRIFRRHSLLLSLRLVLWPALWPGLRWRMRRMRPLRSALRSGVRPSAVRVSLWLCALRRRLLCWRLLWRHRTGVRPLCSRSLCRRMLRKLSSELRRCARVRRRLQPDPHLRNNAGSSPRCKEPARLSAIGGSG